MELKPSFHSQQASALMMTRMTSSVTSLIDYLKQLHLFGETFDHFWTSQKKSTSVTVEIP